MTGVENVFIIGWGGKFETWEDFSAKLSTGEATGAHLTGALGQDAIDNIEWLKMGERGCLTLTLLLG